MQTTSHILLIRPAHFGYNPQTAESNAFQHEEPQVHDLALKAREEFDAFHKRLADHGVNVLVAEDTPFPVKPDAVFPNNWASFHADGTVVLYPMQAPNRRLERRLDVIESLHSTFRIERIIDLSHYELEGRFLEGTGSIVFDHLNRIAYACLSPRTDERLLRELCGKIGYSDFVFHAEDRGGMKIYHTNVMMCIGDKFAVLCLDSIKNGEKQKVISSLHSTGHEIVEISFSQMNNFAGNMLAVHTQSGEQLLVMSATAHKSLTEEQVAALERYAKLLPMPVGTIETVGGGSARCMMAEIFLPLQ